jgi:hypothetical protein
VFKAKQVFRVVQVSKVFKEIQEFRARQVFREIQESKARQVFRVLLVIREIQGSRG